MDALEEERDAIKMKKVVDIAPVHSAAQKNCPVVGSIWDQSKMKVKSCDANSESSNENEDLDLSDWLWGGSVGERGTLLFFRSCVLASKDNSQLVDTTEGSENSSNEFSDIMDPFGPSVCDWDSDDFDTNSETDTEDRQEVLNNKRKRDFKGVLSDINLTAKNGTNITVNPIPNIHNPLMGKRILPSKKLGMSSKSSSLPCSINSLDSDKSIFGINIASRATKSMDPKKIKVPDRKKMPAAILNVRYKTAMAETKLLSKMLQAHGLVDIDVNSKDFNLMWSGLHPKPDILRSLASHQRVNHFPRSYELTRKDKLFKNIEKMQYICGAKNFDFIPLTFMMPVEYKELSSVHYRIKGPWIVKPAASSRGRGIYIVNTPDQIPKGESVVVAKYIDKPLLVDGHKCDLRLYVCVTSFDPLLIYMYEEGLVRFATVKYDKSNKTLWNPCMHLCNYSINKYHSDYVKCEDPSVENVGHKWTLSAFLRNLRNQGHDTCALMSSIEELVVKSILSCTQSIASASKMFVPYFSNCFELYGFDILIDETLKPWLLEINLSPSLGCDSPLDVRLKSSLLADTLNLVGIPAVDPSLKKDPSQRICRSVNLKMRIKGCRRVHSAENMSSKKRGFSSSGSGMSNGSDASSLTNEEIRVIKLVKAQYKRRGGFVRIFPSQDSWKKYAQYLDPITGIPVCNLSTRSSSFTSFGTHNYNLLVHMHVIPNFDQTVVSQNDPPERLKRYERILPACTKVTLDADLENEKSGPNSKHSANRKSHLDSKIAKYHLKQQIQQGAHLTLGESRRTFGMFLMCVLKRISNSPSEQSAQHADLILRFLKRVSHTLKMPYNIKNPSQKMSDKDKAAVIAKQLNDFLHIYHRETDSCIDSNDLKEENRNNNFSQFIYCASEADLEEILLAVLRREGNVVPFLGDRLSPMCVDIPPSSSTSLLKDGLRHQLLKYLAYVTPVHSRRYKPPSPERVSSLPPLSRN